MAKNPDYPANNQSVYMQDVFRRVYDNLNNDAIRVNVVAGNISINPGDIHIGAVEIKDEDVDVRCNVITIGTKNALLIKDIDEYWADQNNNQFNQFGTVNIAKDSELTIVTYTVPINKILKITGLIIGGNTDGEFKLIKNGTEIMLFRNSAAYRTQPFVLPMKVKLNYGETIEIICKNVGRQTRQFEASLVGYQISV